MGPDTGRRYRPTCVHIRRHIATYLLIHMHTHIHMCMIAQRLVAVTHSPAYTCSHKHIRSSICACRHTHTFIHVRIRTHAYIHPYAYTHTHIHPYAYADTRIHSSICAYSHTFIHMHTHAHTYIHTYILWMVAPRPRRVLSTRSACLSSSAGLNGWMAVNGRT